MQVWGGREGVQRAEGEVRELGASCRYGMQVLCEIPTYTTHAPDVPLMSTLANLLSLLLS